MDLAVGDVHVPGAVKKPVLGYTDATMADLPSKKRNALPDSQFAWPEQRKFPVADASHVRNAAARLAQEVKAGRISKATAAKIHRRIAAAGKKFGVEVTASDDVVSVMPVGYVKPEAAAPDAVSVMPRGPYRKPAMTITYDHPEHGKFEIRHMKDGTDELRQVLEFSAGAADGDGPVWNQISTRGSFKGHGAGEFSLDDTTLGDIVRNYSEIDGKHVSFDFEHASEGDATSGSIPVTGAPAQAWIKELKVQPDGLHALVEWLEPAKTYIREKKYKFVSPAIRFGARHPVSGKQIGARLTSVALTNQPFLRGLQPLAAKDIVAAAGTTLRTQEGPST
jgi:hypothetical protein